MPKISMAKAQSIAAKAVGKLMAKPLSKMSLERQVELTHKFIGMAGMESVRKDLLGDAGLNLDIRDMLKAGKTPEEVKSFYWDCKPWRELWVDTMQCMEGMLDLIIEQEVIKKGGTNDRVR